MFKGFRLSDKISKECLTAHRSQKMQIWQSDMWLIYWCITIWKPLIVIHLKCWLNLPYPTQGISMCLLILTTNRPGHNSAARTEAEEQNPCSVIFLPRKTWSPFGDGKIPDFGIHPLTGRRRPSAMEGDSRMKRSPVIWDKRRIPH